MDKIQGNYLLQSNKDFPLDCETLDYIAKNQAMCEMLGNIAGDKIILAGCELQSGNLQRAEGYVFLRTTDFPKGEVLRWEGGAVSSGMYVKKTDTSVSANGYTYPKAYTTRSLAPGTGTENYSWSDFTDISEATNKALKNAYDALKAEVDALVGEPLGIIKMWAGTTAPTGYHLCDGAELDIDTYSKLYKAIGTTFNNAKDCNGSSYTTGSGKFRLPDLRGRFIVGYHDTDTDYNSVGDKVGGEKKHTLVESEMPEHTHVYSSTNRADATELSGTKKNGESVTYKRSDYLISDYTGASSDGGDNKNGLYETTSTGGGTSHENRPPYYVLAYIMKIS